MLSESDGISMGGWVDMGCSIMSGYFGLGCSESELLGSVSNDVFRLNWTPLWQVNRDLHMCNNDNTVWTFMPPCASEGHVVGLTAHSECTFISEQWNNHVGFMYPLLQTNCLNWWKCCILIHQKVFQNRLHKHPARPYDQLQELWRLTPSLKSPPNC